MWVLYDFEGGFLYDFECGFLYGFDGRDLYDYECCSYSAMNVKDMITNVAVYDATNVARDDECALRNFDLAHFPGQHGFFECPEPSRYPRNFHMSLFFQITWFF